MKKVIGIYLAAGKSSRMKGDKKSLPFYGTTLGSIALQKAIRSACDAIVVVVNQGDKLQWLEPLQAEPLWKDRCHVVVCEVAEFGQAYSLQTGIKAAKEIGADAILVLLADMPFVSLEMINQPIFQFRSQESMDYAASGHQGILCPPILLSASLFPELMKLEGDKGARALLRKSESLNGMVIDYENATYFYDIDTPEQYLEAGIGLEKFVEN